MGSIKSVRVVPFEEADDGLPTYQPGRDLVVFPSETSVCWSELSEGELSAARRIILVDCRCATKKKTMYRRLE